MKLRSYVDSGAARSVCPQTHAAQFPLVEDGKKNGGGFLTATGKRVQPVGGRRVEGINHDGRRMQMNYVVAPVRMPLDSVSQICDTGATVVFTKTGGRIVDASGAVTTFSREKDAYIREMWVPRDPARPGTPPFTRQRATS